MGRDGCLMLGWPVAASVGGGFSPGCRLWCLWCCLVLCCSSSRGMSMEGSGIELNQFLRIFLLTSAERFCN